jgi:hypothetical protein
VVAKPPLSRGAALALALGSAAALVLALGIVLVVTRTSLLSRPPAADPRVAVTSEPPAPAAPVESTSAAPVTPASAAPPAPPAATSVVRPTTKVRPPTRPPSQANKKACEIPFVIDAKGQKHFKPECVTE